MNKKRENSSNYLFQKNKKGWIEIVEAVMAILLVAAVLLVTVSKGYIGKSDISESVYKTELSILREIETNDSFRAEIIGLSTLPVEWKDFPADMIDKIKERTPNYLSCSGKICKLCEGEVCQPDEAGLPCSLEEEMKKDIYSQSVVISGSITTGTPPITTVIYRRLKLFCWTKSQVDKCAADGTLYGSCSTVTIGKYCDNGNLVNNCACCPIGQICNLAAGTCSPAPTCDGVTLYEECSATKPQYCNSQGNLVVNCTYCGCPTGQHCKVSTGWGGIKVESCDNVLTCQEDGTFYEECSTVTIGKYCENGNLIERCDLCGCPTGQECKSSGWGGAKYCRDLPECIDGTTYGQCSTVTIGKYCENGNLIDRCDLCGCPTGKKCVSRGWPSYLKRCENV